MEMGISELRNSTISKILARQDENSRWAFDEQVATERPEFSHYLPKYKATLWTLLLMADLKAPTNIPQIDRSIQVVFDHFYDKVRQIFSVGRSHFPIPCLNGNLLYLHFYFEKPYTEQVDKVVEFFNLYQRFDDGDFKTPSSFPYFSNKSCYGKHTCYWGVIKLLKGLSFIPSSLRTKNAQHLIENCIDYVLHHEVCFRSHKKDEFIHPRIGQLTFPNFYNCDFLEVLWLLARERIKDKKISRAIHLLSSKMNEDGYWELEKPINNLIVTIGRKGRANPFITERALEVLEFYEA
jgi:hypothetical protein